MLLDKWPEYCLSAKDVDKVAHDLTPEHVYTVHWCLLCPMWWNCMIHVAKYHHRTYTIFIIYILKLYQLYLRIWKCSLNTCQFVKTFHPYFNMREFPRWWISEMLDNQMVWIPMDFYSGITYMNSLTRTASSVVLSAVACAGGPFNDSNTSRRSFGA